MGKGKENQGNQNIAVYVRCRPLNSQEKKVSSASVVEMNCERREVKIDKLQKTLTFDRVFDGSSSQVDLYKVVVSPMLEEVLAGYSCTVFAYGQTGTGKTYTMEGERSCRRETSWEEDPSSGIVPRAMHHLFETLREQGLDYSLRVSFLELYNEELFDLLAPLDDASKIRLYDDPIRKGSVIVNGIEEVAVHSRDEVYAILERGTQKRQTAMTLMNANSSRSHTVFSITVHIKENNLEGEELMKTGKLNLVDLAGSENVGRSGAVDKRAREAGNINQSLLTLGRVITALVERSPHIPYRESKLTRLLQDSLGGKTKTSIIATISPASINIEETLSTLDYANRAKNIMNKPETNQRLTKKTLLKQYTEEIERLRRDLTAAREKNGVYMDPEDYNRMTKTIDELEQRLKALTEEFEKLNEMFAKTKLDLEERDSQLTETQTNLRSTRTTLESTVVVLNKTTQDRDERNVILDARAKTEKSLTDQAKQLIDVADVATSDIPQLHDKINRKQTVEDYNREKKDNYHSEAKHLTEKLSLYSKQKHDDESTFLQSIIASLDEQLAKSTSELQSSRTLISKFEECIFNTISLLNTVLAEQAKESTEAIERTTQAKKSRSNDFSTKLVSNLKLQLEQLISSSINDNVKISDSIRIANTEIIKKVEQLQNSLSFKLQEQLCQLEVFEKNFNELYQVQKVGTESTQSQIKHIAQMDNERYSIFQNLVALLSSNGANLQSQLAGFLSDVANLQSINDSDRQNRHSELEMVSQGVKTYDNHSTSMKSQIQNYSTNQATSFRGLDKEVLSSAKTIIDSTEELMNEFKVSATEALTKMNDLKHEVHLLQTFIKEEMENDVQCIEKESLLQLEINQAAREQQLEKIQILSDTTKANTNLQYEFFEMTKTQSCDFIISQKEIVHKEVEKSYKNRELGNQIVNEMDEALDTYFKNYRDDVPSGATPNRRQFNYPKTLAATSPEDRIIERHRKQMKLNLRVIEDEDSIDEIASDSSEASCLNSSIASSLRSISNQNLSDMDESKENQLPLVDENIFKKPEAEKKTTGTIPRIIKRPLRSKNVDSS